MSRKGQWTDKDFVHAMTEMAAEAKKRGISLLEYRLSTLYWIIDERTNQMVRFKPNHVQRLVLRNLWFLTFILKARQHGVSTLLSLVLLDMSLFNANYRAAIVDRTDAEGKKKLSKMRFAYDNLDKGEGGAVFQFGAMLRLACPLVAPTNDHTLTFANGSTIFAATTHRGATANWLWVSEFGYIASEDPGRASEIASGSFNAVHPGNFITIETTHEGGRFGLSYEMTRAAQANANKDRSQLSKMQWRLLFFGWQENEEYQMEVPRGTMLQIPAVLVRYFTALEASIGHQLSDAQKNWYVQKWATPGVDMARQFPGTIEEALSAQTEGAIYGDQISLLRAKGRICDLAVDGHAPFVTSWDLGMSDYTSIWLVQLTGQDVLVHDYLAASGETPAQFAAKLILWERAYRPISMHFLPHDALNRGIDGKTYKDLLTEAGVRNIKVVPRTPDIWVGINAVRALLPKCYFNGPNCEKEFKKEGERVVLPSGLASLEGYRKKIEATTGNIKEMPIHNEASHGSDAFRTLAEAQIRGMLANVTSFPTAEGGRVKVIREHNNQTRNRVTVLR